MRVPWIVIGIILIGAAIGVGLLDVEYEWLGLSMMGTLFSVGITLVIIGFLIPSTKELK